MLFRLLTSTVLATCCLAGCGADAHTVKHVVKHAELHLPTLNTHVKYGNIYHSYPTGVTPSGTEVMGPIYQNGQDVTLSLSTIVSGTPVVTGIVGSVARNAVQKSFDVVNVKDFGAKGDGVTDDSTAIQAAITAALASGYNARVVFPSGMAYVLNEGLTASLTGAQSLSFGSSSPGAHQVRLLVGANVNTALSVVMTSAQATNESFSMPGLDWVHTASGTNQTAVSITVSNNSAAQFPSLDVSHQTFTGTNGSFAVGMSLLNVNVTDMDHVTCYNNFAGTCVKYDSNGPLSVEHHLSDIYVNGPAVDAIMIGHTGMPYSVQGFTIDRLSCTGTVDCVDVYGAATAVDELAIRGSQINSTAMGVNAQSADTVVLVGNYFLGNATGVNLVGGSRFVFTGNTCYEGRTGTTANRCIVLNATGTGAASGATISGNVFTNLYGIPILIENGANYSLVSGNTCLGNKCVSDTTLGTGTTNAVGPNYEGSTAGNTEYQDTNLVVGSGLIMGNGTAAASLNGDGNGNVKVSPNGAGTSANIIVTNGSVIAPNVFVGTTTQAPYLSAGSNSISFGNLTKITAPTVQSSAGSTGALPTCNSAAEGSRGSVTDATSSTWGATLVGGGSNHEPAYCNGTNWIVE